MKDSISVKRSLTMIERPEDLPSGLVDSDDGGHSDGPDGQGVPSRVEVDVFVAAHASLVPG